MTKHRDDSFGGRGSRSSSTKFQFISITKPEQIKDRQLQKKIRTAVMHDFLDKDSLQPRPRQIKTVRKKRPHRGVGHGKKPSLPSIPGIASVVLRAPVLQLSPSPQLDLGQSSRSQLQLLRPRKLALPQFDGQFGMICAQADPTRDQRLQPCLSRLEHHHNTYLSSFMVYSEHLLDPVLCLYLEKVNNGNAVNSPPERQALYHASMAVAARTLQRLQPTDTGILERLMVHHETVATQKLQHSIDIGCEDDGSFLYCVLNLMALAQLNRTPQVWKVHQAGACMFLKLKRSTHSLATDRLACSAASLLSSFGVLLRTRLMCSFHGMVRLHPSDRPVQTVDAVGLYETSYAARSAMECVFESEEIKTLIAAGSLSAREAHVRIDSMQEGLDAIEESITLSSDPTQAELRQHCCWRAYIGASRIYTHRELPDVPPRGLRRYVKAIFDLAEVHRMADGKCFPQWPAFLAAFEASHESDIDVVRTWLNDRKMQGFGDYAVADSVLSEVWRRREVLSRELATDADLVAIDRQKVAPDLKLDHREHDEVRDATQS